MTYQPPWIPPPETDPVTGIRFHYWREPPVLLEPVVDDDGLVTHIATPEERTRP